MRSVLGQTALAGGKVELEYLIVDGASTDGTRQVVESCGDARIRFSSEPDRGLYDAVAKGFTACRGEIVTYLNAGDLLHPEAFALVANLMSREGVDWLTGSNLKINEAGQVIDFWKASRYRREFILNGTYLGGDPYPCIQQEGTFFRHKLLDRVDLPRLRSARLAGDYFLWTELAKQTELHSVTSFLAAFRVHEGQLSEALQDYAREARSFTRPETRREHLTRYWEYHCPPRWRGALWNFTLGQSAARIFKFDEGAKQWRAR